MLTDEELYEGLTKEQAEKYNDEAMRLYDPKVVKSVNKRIRSWSKEYWMSVKDEGAKIYEELGMLMKDHPTNSKETLAVIERHHAHIEKFFSAPADVYKGLAAGYAEHPDFRAFFDKIRKGLADYIREAIDYYAEKIPSSEEK